MEIAARARLRPNKDEDLIKAWKNLPPHEDKSDVVRRALRLLFFGSESNSIVVHPVASRQTYENQNIQSIPEQNEDAGTYEEKLDELFGSL